VPRPFTSFRAAEAAVSGSLLTLLGPDLLRLRWIYRVYIMSSLSRTL
jgi:hypothetical protein